MAGYQSGDDESMSKGILAFAISGMLVFALALALITRFITAR